MPAMVVSYNNLTSISSEHFVNRATMDLLHSMHWSPGLNLNNPNWNMISHGKNVLHYYECMLYAKNPCHKFVFSQEYTLISKVELLCLSTISETTRWPLFVYPLSMISDYAITWATPHWFCKAGELTRFPYMRYPGKSALVQVMAGHLFGAKPLPKVILTFCQLHPWE